MTAAGDQALKRMAGLLETCSSAELGCYWECIVLGVEGVLLGAPSSDGHSAPINMDELARMGYGGSRVKFI